MMAGNSVFLVTTSPMKSLLSWQTPVLLEGGSENSPRGETWSNKKNSIICHDQETGFWWILNVDHLLWETVLQCIIFSTRFCQHNCTMLENSCFSTVFICHTMSISRFGGCSKWHFCSLPIRSIASLLSQLVSQWPIGQRSNSCHLSSMCAHLLHGAS